MTKWYANKANYKNPTTHIVPSGVSQKKPCATTGQELFAKAQSEEICVNAWSMLEESGDSTTGANLAFYREAKKLAWESQSSSQRKDWITKADEHNERIKQPPSREHVFKCVLF